MVSFKTNVSDLLEQNNEPERPYISFFVTKVTITAVSTSMKQQDGAAPRPSPSLKQNKPAISLRGQDKPEISHIYQETIAKTAYLSIARL